MYELSQTQSVHSVPNITYIFCVLFVYFVVLCNFIFVCTSVGLLPPGESPIEVVEVVVVAVVVVVMNKMHHPKADIDYM